MAWPHIGKGLESLISKQSRQSCLTLWLPSAQPFDGFKSDFIKLTSAVSMIHCGHFRLVFKTEIGFRNSENEGQEHKWPHWWLWILSSYTSRIIALGISATLAKYCFIRRNDGNGLTLNDCLKGIVTDQGLGEGFRAHVSWRNASHSVWMLLPLVLNSEKETESCSYVISRIQLVPDNIAHSICLTA